MKSSLSKARKIDISCVPSAQFIWMAKANSYFPSLWKYRTSGWKKQPRLSQNSIHVSEDRIFL